MVDYIRDEEEQAELLKEWWQKNGTAVLITVVLAVAALIGWRQWQQHHDAELSSASSQYQVLMTDLSKLKAGQSADKVAADAAALIKDYPSSTYADYARMLQARLAVEKADYDAAIAALTPVADKGATDELQYTAQLRLVRVLIQQQAYDKAQKRLQMDFPKAFSGMALELKGDLAKARNQLDAARNAYAEALDALQDGAEKDRVQMKLDDLKRAS
ncbi:MAG: tetratricopeptide repeat protein [Alcanivorax sp.]|nr:tetratricopeptide repeat protein [Alcanivorax sp.]